MIAALIAKLETELYETEAGYSEAELAYRRGSNDRAKAIVRWLKEQQFDTSNTEPMQLELKRKLVEG